MWELGNVSWENVDQSKQKKKYAASRTICLGRIVCPLLVCGSWSDEARPLYEHSLLVRIDLHQKNLGCQNVSQIDKKRIPPSSTETWISTIPSELSAIEAIFFRFSKGNVNDLLLREIESGQRETSENEPRKTGALDRNSIPYWTVKRVKRIFPSMSGATDVGCWKTIVKIRSVVSEYKHFSYLVCGSPSCFLAQPLAKWPCEQIR